MIASWWRALGRRRDERILRTRPIPEVLWQLTLARFPFLAQRSVNDLAQLRAMATLFLASKEFAGAHGLQVTDEMAVAIAAQACLPVLHLGLHWYDGFVGIVIHADQVRAQREVMDEAGVVHHYAEVLSGEAMEGGPVMLSWHDVAEAGTTADWAYNVAIHEFAHVLDMRNGAADGVPPLRDAAALKRWLQVMGDEYRTFCERTQAGQHTLLDPYGAQSVDEFFAVASEAFFVASSALREEHPELYHLLAGFFRQDPAAACRRNE